MLPSEKHLVLAMVDKLDFDCTCPKQRKYNKIIGIVKRFSVTRPRNTLLTLHKILIRPQLDYADII